MREHRGAFGLLASLLFIVGCTELEHGATSAEVIGGAVTLEGEYPGVGALMYDFGGMPVAGCTGTLIAPNAVLTAAHCLDPDLVGDGIPGFTLALDTTVGAPVIVPGATKYKHEMFSLDVDPGRGLGTFYDIGVLILAQEITTVAPVRMPRVVDAAEILAGIDLEIAGYGKTSVEGDATGILYDAQTQVISMNASELQVGMGSPQPQNCNGDSGGPGFAAIGGMRRVIGIVSRSFDGFECTTGGVDTRVDAYLPWIHEKVPTGIPCDSGLAEACPEPEEEDAGGCCSTSTRALPGSGGLAVLVGGLVLRRRRVRSA